MNVGVLVGPHISASIAIGRQDKWEQAVSRGEGAELRQHGRARYMVKCPHTVYLADAGSWVRVSDAAQVVYDALRATMVRHSVVIRFSGSAEFRGILLCQSSSN